MVCVRSGPKLKLVNTIFVVCERRMPVIKNDEIEMPGWCELQFYELVALAPNEAHTFKRTHPNEKLIIGKGKCQIRFENQIVFGEDGTNLNLKQEDSYFEIMEVIQDTIAIRM